MATPETQYCYRHPDRPTGLSCSECGRPICTECMTPAAVGLRCPEHAGGRRPAAKALGGRVVVRAPQTRLGGTQALVTKTLIAAERRHLPDRRGAGRRAHEPGASMCGAALLRATVLYGPFVAPATGGA